MRVWDVHPGYLKRQGLLGHHAEIHAVFSVIVGQKSGYAHHPETLRWQNHLSGLAVVHDVAVAEMQLRGYQHRSPLAEVPRQPITYPGFVDLPLRQVELLQEKYIDTMDAGRIPLPGNRYYAWAHHKYAVMARNYREYLRVKDKLQREDESDATLWNEWIDLLRRPMERPAFDNTRDHLWGYFRGQATPEERHRYESLRAAGAVAEVLSFLYALALDYNMSYLLQQTIFADIMIPE